MATKQKGVIHPYFQAIGWLEGQLAEKEAGCYQFVTVDGLSLNAIARRKMKKMLRERPELLGADRPWTVYPKTDRQGHLNSVHITGLGGYSRMGGQVDAFYISGRVSIPAQEAGQITVKIQPNRPPKTETHQPLPWRPFRPFYVTLQGHLTEAIEGEIWRFLCQRSGSSLELIDGSKIKGTGRPQTG